MVVWLGCVAERHDDQDLLHPGTRRATKSM